LLREKEEQEAREARYEVLTYNPKKVVDRA
jgi:hypothetical protein